MYNHKKCCGDTMVNDVDRESIDAADVQQDDHEDPDFTELEDDDADVEVPNASHMLRAVASSALFSSLSRSENSSGSARKARQTAA